MPKRVNHEARREDIAKAAFRVIGRKGVTGATIRDIARETGYSVGAIVHYITTRDHILLQAADYSTRCVVERLERAERNNLGLEALRQVVYSSLPGSDGMIGHWKIWFGFWELSERSELIRTALHGRYVASAKLYGQLIAKAQKLGEIDEDISVPQAATSLTCQIDGIGVHVLISGRHMPPSRQRQQIDQWMQRMLPRRKPPAAATIIRPSVLASPSRNV